MRARTAGDDYDIRFLLEAGANEEPICSAESHALQWIALDEIGAYNAEASIARLVDKTRRLPRPGPPAAG